MSTAYHWLVVNGLYQSVVGTLVLLVLTHLLVWRRIRNAFRQIRAELARNNDLLDTQTPGGNTDVVAAVKQLQDKPPSQ